uniref:Lipocalin/cytosolic fatty-acid binding domain-containing protein n=1 Tax=Catagonus wagneri TaxID=51154 RepID=A0A8C3VVB3_9CETA
MRGVLLLTVTLGLATAPQAQGPLFFPVETPDITGTLYVKALVTDEDVPKEWRTSKVFPETVTALDSGDLEVTFTFMWERVVLQPTEEPGKYSAYEGRHYVYVSELPVEGHFVFYCESLAHGESFHAAKLMGKGAAGLRPRRPPPNPAPQSLLPEARGAHVSRTLVPEYEPCGGPGGPAVYGLGRGAATHPA